MKAFSNYSKRRAYCDPSVLDNWAKNFLRNSAYNVVISGHDHHPRVHEYEFGTYINTGTFFKHRTVGLYNNGELQLVSWDATKKSFEPYDNSLQVTYI